MEILDKIRHRFLWVLLCTIVGIAVGVGYAYSTGGGYRATARLFVSTSATDAIAAAQGDIAGQSRVKTYAALGTGQLLLERAAKRAHSGVGADYIADRLTVVSIPGTVILEVDVTADTADVAASLADAVSTELTDLATEVETPINGGPRAQGLLTIQPASSGIVKIGRLAPKPIALGGILGVIAGLFFAAIVPTRKAKTVAAPAKHASVDTAQRNSNGNGGKPLNQKVSAAPGASLHQEPWEN